MQTMSGKINLNLLPETPILLDHQNCFYDKSLPPLELWFGKLILSFFKHVRIMGLNTSYVG